MTAQEKHDTKVKILKAANELFARKGFGGTSVRDIATTADVNLAAINYHFNNKENLYWKVFDYNYDVLKEKIGELGEEKNNTEDLTIAVLHYFLADGSAIMNCFKIFLNDNSKEQNPDLKMYKEERMGPPGAEVFYAKIKEELGGNISDEAAFWAVKMIFSLIVHLGVVMNTTMMKQKMEIDPTLGPEFMEMSVRNSVRAHLNYLKENPELPK